MNYCIIYSDELSHHGIKNQHWGIKNGPPYPLAASIKSKVYSRKRLKQIKAEEAAENERKQKAEAHEKDRQHAINSGDPVKVKKYRNEMSQAELDSAIRRIRSYRDIDAEVAKDTPKQKTAYDKLRSTSDAVNTAANLASGSVKLYNSTAPIMNALFGTNLKQVKADKQKSEDKKKQQQKGSLITINNG